MATLKQHYTEEAGRRLGLASVALHEQLKEPLFRLWVSELGMSGADLQRPTKGYNKAREGK